MTFRPHGAWAVLASSVTALGCSQSTVVLPSRDLDRPTDMAFTCMALVMESGENGSVSLRLSPRPMGQCHPSGAGDPMPPKPLNPAAVLDTDPTKGGPQTQYRTYAFVTNTDRGDLSVVDMSFCRPGDTRCWPPGAGLVDLDPTFVGYGAAPLGVLPEVVAASQDGCRLVSANRGSCDLTLVNPEVLLTASAVSGYGAAKDPAVTASAPPINTFATTVVLRTTSGQRLNLAPGEIAFLPQQTGQLLPGAPKPGAYCDATGTFAAPVGAPPPIGAGTSVPWRAIVTFPSCDLIAMVELPSGNIVDSYQLHRQKLSDGTNSYSFQHAGGDPICPRSDCGGPATTGPAGADAGSDDAATGVGADASGDDTGGVDASSDDATDGDAGPGPGAGSGDAGVSVVPTGTLDPTGTLNVNALAIHPEGKRVYFGATNADIVAALDISGDTLQLASTTALHSGAAGVTRIRLSVDPFAYSKGHDAGDTTRPEYGRFVAGSHDGQDPPLEFLYVMARDGTLRVLDVAGAGGRAPYECDLAIDPTDPAANATGEEAVPSVRTPCFEYPPPAAGAPKRFPGGPGLRLAGAVQDVAFASYLTPRITKDYSVDESALSGAFAFAMTSTGAVYIINIDPELRLIKEIRNGAPGRFPESPRPLTHSLRDVNVLSYSSGLGPQSGAPRLDTPPTGPATGPALDSFTTRETALNATAVPIATGVGPTEMLTLPPSGNPGPLTSVYFPNRATVNPQQWSIAWEGDLTGIRLTGDLRKSANQFADSGAGFCGLGALAGDVVTLTGCSDSTNCGPGTICVHGTGVPPSVDGRTIPGLCLEQNHVADLMTDDHCGRLLKTFRRYEITSSDDRTLTLRPKKDELPRPVYTIEGERTTCQAPQVNADCHPDGDTAHARFNCEKVPVATIPSCDPSNPTCVPSQPTHRCLQKCAVDTECRQGRVCVQFVEGKPDCLGPPLADGSRTPDGSCVCAEADPIKAECFPQLVSYKISAGNTFVVSGTAAGRPEAVAETAGPNGPECNTVSTVPGAPLRAQVARIPMNSWECDSSVKKALYKDDPLTVPLIDTAVRGTIPIPQSPCFIVTPDPTKKGTTTTTVPRVFAFYENAEIRFVLKDLDHQISDGFQIRFETHGGVQPQFVSPSADAAPGLPARILLGPIPQPDQAALSEVPLMPVMEGGRPVSDLPYLFVVDQRQYSGGRLGPRGQILRITPRITDTVPLAGFETFAAGGKYFPIQ